jgi:hypothetical protein
MPDAAPDTLPLILTTSGAADVPITFVMPTHDDDSPSSDDEGSFAIVVFADNDPRARVVTIRRTPLLIDSSGIRVR